MPAKSEMDNSSPVKLVSVPVTEESTQEPVSKAPKNSSKKQKGNIVTYTEEELRAMYPDNAHVLTIFEFLSKSPDMKFVVPKNDKKDTPSFVGSLSLYVKPEKIDPAEGTILSTPTGKIFIHDRQIGFVRTPDSSSSKSETLPSYQDVCSVVHLAGMNQDMLKPNKTHIQGGSFQEKLRYLAMIQAHNKTVPAELQISLDNKFLKMVSFFGIHKKEKAQAKIEYKEFLKRKDFAFKEPVDPETEIDMDAVSARLDKLLEQKPSLSNQSSPQAPSNETNEAFAHAAQGDQGDEQTEDINEILNKLSLSVSYDIADPLLNTDTLAEQWQTMLDGEGKKASEILFQNDHKHDKKALDVKTQKPCVVYTLPGKGEGPMAGTTVYAVKIMHEGSYKPVVIKIDDVRGHNLWRNESYCIDGDIKHPGHPGHEEFKTALAKAFDRERTKRPSEASCTGAQLCAPSAYANPNLQVA